MDLVCKDDLSSGHNQQLEYESWSLSVKDNYLFGKDKDIKLGSGVFGRIISWPIAPPRPPPPSGRGDQFMSAGKKLLMTLDNETLSTKTFNLPRQHQC